jgi:hypothetical protein
MFTEKRAADGPTAMNRRARSGRYEIENLFDAREYADATYVFY